MTHVKYCFGIIVAGLACTAAPHAQEAIGSTDRNMAVNQVNQAVAISVSATLSKYLTDLNGSINTLRTCGASSRFAADNKGNCK